MTDSASPPQHRPIRSFVRREGRLTPGQQRALDELWPTYGLELGDEDLDLDTVFGRRAARVLEIGFGNGESLLAMAAAAPELDFLGIEVHRPGVGHLLMQAGQLGVTNLRVLCTDATAVIRRLAPGSLERVQIFFPDPWPKKRHHKRRIVQPEFVAQLVAALRIGGTLHLATDWQDYAEHMLATLEANPSLANTAGSGNTSPRPDYRPETKFERRGLRLGHGVWDLVFTRTR